MKTLKLCFLAALLCGFALNSNAQTDTRSWENIWTLSVNCDGEVDVLMGPVHGHIIDHYNPVTGDFEWYRYTIKSTELVSQTTGEIFRINGFELGKTEGSFPWPTGGDIYTSRWRNFIGNQGSHYHWRVITLFDWSTFTSHPLKVEIKCK